MPVAVLRRRGWRRIVWGFWCQALIFGLPVLCSELEAVFRPVACDQVRGARGRGQGTETVAKLGGLPPSAWAFQQALPGSLENVNQHISARAVESRQQSADVLGEHFPSCGAVVRRSGFTDTEPIPAPTVLEPVGLGYAQCVFKGVRLPQQSKKRATLVALNSRDRIEKVGRSNERTPKRELPDLVGELGDPLKVIENAIPVLLRESVDDRPNLLDEFWLLVVPIDSRPIVSTFVKIGFQTLRRHPPEKFWQTEAHRLLPDIVLHPNRCSKSRVSTPAYKGEHPSMRCGDFSLGYYLKLTEIGEAAAVIDT
jgi:hypothetical protein